MVQGIPSKALNMEASPILKHKKNTFFDPKNN